MKGVRVQTIDNKQYHSENNTKLQKLIHPDNV